MPRLKSETVGAGDQSWLGSTHGIYDTITVVLDVSTFTAATHFPTGHMPSGTALNIANEKSAKPYTGAAGEKLAFLYTDQAVVGAADFGAPVLAHGTIKLDRLPDQAFAPSNGAGAFVFRDGVK